MSGKSIAYTNLTLDDWVMAEVEAPLNEPLMSEGGSPDPEGTRPSCEEGARVVWVGLEPH